MKSHSKFVFHILTLFALLASLLGSALTVTPVYAAGITVTTTTDELNADGDCSLREAIQAANTDLAADTCAAGSGADIITVPAGTYTLTIAGAGEDANATGDLDITSSLTINGAGAGSTIIRAGVTPGSGIDRVFDVKTSITVSISDVTIANGNSASYGGGIINDGGTLTVTNSTFSGNSALTNGGGGIAHAGTLTVTNSTFSGNSAPSGGGIYHFSGTAMITNSTFSSNSATSYGGGIYTNSSSVLTVTNSTFSGNSATSYGGGITNSGTATVTNSTFSGNSAALGGGILNDISDNLTVTNSTFSGNSAANNGGGLINGGTATVTNSTFSGNSASSGGGLYNQATLHLKNTILANSSSGADCVTNGAISTDINNLIETNGAGGSACGTPSVTGDPSLGALADNGGSTQTFALLPSSPALDAGDNTICDDTPPGPDNLDQRGVVRPQNGMCDIGAFESNAQPGPSFEVNSTEDSLDGSCDAFVAGVSDCTLREAVTAANLFPSADTINVPAGTYTLTITGVAEDANATGDLDITDSLAINGAGAGSTIIQAGAVPGSGIDRVFDVFGAISVSISGIKIENGYCTSCNGGGIRNIGTLSVTSSTFSYNFTSSSGGNGGGVYNTGTLTITKSTFSNNSTFVGNGGGITNDGGTLSVTNSTFSNNNSLLLYGGGITNFGALTLANSTFSGNSATTTGGGIWNIGVLNLKNTILANSASGGDCYNFGDTIAINMNNLIETNGPSGHMCGAPAVTADPGLGALTGSPAYFPLNIGSPATNAGNDAICAAVPVSNTSQNGVTRPQGAHCDIGSFELFVYNLFLPLVLR